MTAIVPKSEPHRIFGMSLRAMRERSGQSQFVVAARAAIQKKSYAEYELGLKAPSALERVHRLCEAVAATDDERTALVEVWGTIGSNNRITHVAAMLSRMADNDEPILTPVDPELRRLQDVIDAMKRCSHDDAPFMWAGVLNCVKKIQQQGETWLKTCAKGTV